MNKIIIDKNKLLDYKDKYINIKNNNIDFISNNEYMVEVINTKKLDLVINVKDNVLVKVFIYSIDNDIDISVKYVLGNNSKLCIEKFYNNINTVVKEDIYLDGEYSEIDYRLSGISRYTDDYKINIYHNNLHVRSNISNKYMGIDGSKITYKIDSILEKGNTDCYMNQDTKIMCMGDVDARIEPNMLIDEDDVEARHGSVIGKFNYDDLFYLMSRGISEVDAMSLMIRGFILSHLVINDYYREKILDIIKKTIE